MLISIHLPKTGGISFRSSLENHFGNHILKDYKPISIFRGIFNICYNNFYNNFRPLKKIECIHGHFFIAKYLSYKLRRNVIFLTWMRDPVEMLASYYYFIKRNTHIKEFRRISEANQSLEHFCFNPQFRNIYSIYLWLFPIKLFDFIGITEYYETELEYFSNKYLGSSLKVKKENVNPNKKGTLYIQDPKLRKEIEKYHSKDVKLYKYALKMRLKSRGI